MLSVNLNIQEKPCFMLQTKNNVTIKNLCSSAKCKTAVHGPPEIYDDVKSGRTHYAMKKSRQFG